MLGEENTMLPMLTIAHNMQMDCGWLKDCTRPNLTLTTLSAMAGFSVERNSSDQPGYPAGKLINPWASARDMTSSPAIISTANPAKS